MTDIVSVLRRGIAPLTRTAVFRRFAPTILPVLERVSSVLTGGRLQIAGILVPALELRTLGARTGEPRSNRLMYLPDGPGRAIVAGTNFGRGHHPGWTYNLRANPDAEVVIRARVYRVRATELQDGERDAVWQRIEAQWPGYRAYERASARTVRLFRLQAAADPAEARPSASLSTAVG